ncbi:MAG: YHS domain-containing (seleno)protein [Chitinophagaceae bacterium]
MKLLLFALVLSFSTSAIAQKNNSEIFQTDGKAIKGYDVVAFYTDAKPIAGNEKFVHNWKGVSWLFNTQEHLDSFKISPEKYAPQYGGYCAYGIADGHKAPTETGTWTIIENKLYFNYNDKVKQLWNKKPKEYIEKADNNWKVVKNSEF